MSQCTFYRHIKLINVFCEKNLLFYHNHQKLIIVTLLKRTSLMNNQVHKPFFWQLIFNPDRTKIFLYKQWRTKGFFQFEIITNVLVSSFHFIWIPMLWGLWVYGHYEYLIHSVRGSYILSITKFGLFKAFKKPQEHFQGPIQTAKVWQN